MFDNGNFILGTGTTDTGHKLTISGDLYVNTIANAIVDTDRFIVSDGGIIKYRTGAQILTDIGAVSSVGLTMPAAFTVSNSPITSSGTIAVTGAGTAAQYIRGDGTLGDFPGGGGGGGASVSYYLNGSVNQGTFGGNTYYEMNKTPIFGPGTDFNISVDGYVAQFITDVGDPDALLIPGGNWNFETYFSASSGGGSPTFYIELYKYDGTTFTLIASNSTNPELIAFGTTVNPYFSALAVPETVLLATDRLAVRIYVSTSGRTITLHTENSNLCQVITTFTTGLTALNGLTKQVQYFSVGTSGTDFNISSSVATHTFNLPTASAVNRGALSSADWTTFNSKQNALTLTTSGSSGPATLIGATLNIPDYGSALSGYVPYTGASQAVNLGIHSLSGGTLFVNGTSPTSGSYLGFKQATSVTTGGGGYTSISTFGTSQMNFSFAQPSGFKEFKFDVSSITTGVPGGRVYTMPDADGTIALTSNIPSGIITGTGTTNYLPKFTGTSSIGNSIVQDAGIRVDIGGDIRLTPTSAVNIQAYTGSVYTNLFYNAASHNWQTSGGVTKMFLNSNDNLLIGTTTDGGQRLQVTGTVALRASASGSSATQIPIFAADPSGTTRELVTRTPAQLLSDIGGQAALTNPVTGTGTTNYLPKFTGSTTVGNSAITDDGTSVNVISRTLTITRGNYSAFGFEINQQSTFAFGSTNGKRVAIITDATAADNGLQFGYDTVDKTGIIAGSATSAGAGIDFYTYNGSAWGNRARVTASGNLLVGTTTDNGARLQVSGSASIGGTNTYNGWIIGSHSNNVGSALYNKGNVAQTMYADSANTILNAETTLYLRTANSDKLTITSSGNVGIGTTSPSNGRLEVLTSSAVSYNPAGFNVVNLALRSGSGTTTGSIVGLTMGLGGSAETMIGAVQTASGTADIVFQSFNGSAYGERMRITSGGNLLVGTTTDNGARLQVNGFSRFDRGTLQFTLNPSYAGGNVYTQLQSTGDLALASGGDNNRLYITSSGNVGIGTTSPSAVLEVQGGNGNQLDLDNTGQQFTQLNFRHNGTQRSAIWIDNTNSLFEHYVVSGYGQTFYTNATERMRITSGGNVLIGTTTDAGYKLDVNGTGRFTSNLYTSTALYINTTAAYGFRINSEGNNGFYNRGGSTVSHYPFLLENSSGALLFQVQGTGAATFSSSVTATELYLSTSNGLVGNINSSNANGGYLTWQTSGTTIADIGTAQQIFGTGGNDTFGINGRGARAIAFGTNNSERMRITSGGNVGIGTSSPTNGLLVINSTASNGVRFALESSGTMNGIVALGSNAMV